MTAASPPVAPAVEMPGTTIGSRLTIPVSLITEWQVANADPTTLTGTPQRTDSVLTSGGAAVVPIKMNGAGTSVQFCLRYDPSGGHTTTTSPVIWAIGLSAAGVAWRLLDNAATPNESWTLTPDSGNDCASAANAYYTKPVVVDATGADQVILVIDVAAVGTAFAVANGGAILAHVL